MAVYTHGGDILSARAHYGGEILDFSANLNLLGMPEQVRSAAEAAISGAIHYPDPYCRELVAAIARHDGVPVSNILCGNGAADLIFRFAYSERAKRALVTAPTFTEYEQAMTAAGTAVEHFLLREEEGFAVTERLLEALEARPDVLFLCNPNNPTGRPVDRPLLLRIFDRCAEKGIRLVLDECFLELTDGGCANGMAECLQAYPNLFLLRAFTKSFAIPGLRLGYCLTADPALLERLTLSAQPWSVSAPAQAAGIAALGIPEYPAHARAVIRQERAVLSEGLAALGVKVYPSATNYILFRAEGIHDLKERLLARGILIRSCANYAGLSPAFYRVAVRKKEENLALLQALKETL